MTGVPLSELAVAVLLVFSGVVVLAAALGLWRLPDFFLRMHAPALASTLGAWVVTLASIIFFSAREQGLDLHAWLIIVVLAMTAPVTTMVLARAGVFTDRREHPSTADAARPSGRGKHPSKGLRMPAQERDPKQPP